jgi:anti-sigma regulatory factor (Ser/Thr protein kinase)
MRRTSDKRRALLIRRQQRRWLKQRRQANSRRHRSRAHQIFRNKHREYFERKETREELRRKLYFATYNAPPLQVQITGEFGIEESASIDYFLQTASTFIDFNNTHLTFELANCTRMWPSAITLLCSLMQWVELTTRRKNKHRRPHIESTSSKSDKVNSYLAHCGFYDYVKRLSDTKQDYYSNEEIVKIQRETNSNNIEKREDEIIGLLSKYSVFSRDQIELFNSIVLTEAFANVTEHGVTYRDKGWWVLAQYHTTHAVISLCIADNGMGIRHTLVTGPQAPAILQEAEDTSDNDGIFIKMALEETVSGALGAPQKTTAFFGKGYARGAHRGNGFQRITDTCKQLKIPFSILSHYGYAFVGENGKIYKYGSMDRRIFAGTLYHMVIPARKDIHNANN